KMYKELDKNKVLRTDDWMIHTHQESKTFEVDIKKPKQLVLKKAFGSLGEQFKKLLELYYYEGLTIDEIQNYLGYSSKDVLKSQKTRCLKQLKEFVEKNYE